MKRAALLVAVSMSVLTTALAQQPPIFREDVKLVRLLVTVKNAREELVGALEKGDFNVFDCGVKQDIRLFERQTEQPLSVSLFIDISGSTAKDLKYETVSIGKFLSALFREGNPKDAVALYSFNDEVTILREFTRNQEQLNNRLKDLHAEGGTSLYDAINFGARGLERRDGRHVMVIVTDGGNTTSVLKYKDALESAHRSDSMIFGILVVPIRNDAGRNIGGEHALEQLTLDTGGRMFRPDVEHLDTAFADVIRAIRTQYLIGYYPRDLPRDRKAFHPVRVDVRDASSERRGLRVSTRSGYYEDSKP
jgi:Ca-activated chloride channel family protein